MGEPLVGSSGFPVDVAFPAEGIMHSEKEREYLLKAIEAFKKRLIVVSPDFRILATNCRSDTDENTDET